MDKTQRWLRDWYAPSSYIPLVVRLAKWSLLLNQFPFTIHGKNFVIVTSRKFQRVSAILVLLLHLFVSLTWVIDQSRYPSNPPAPTWKFVLMYYCITVYASLVIFIITCSVRKEETVLLLNSAVQVEQNFISKGEYSLTQE